ncbi:MAG TPA: phytoene/squalene synthase family protein [Pirellulaceae bacterium]|nr:phytoene/squalene synthase family protein [Pirellulaceae bacterium]
MTASLTHSYRRCHEIVRRSGSNFAWAFWLLKRRQRDAMVALYAFARLTDDLGDSAAPLAQKQSELAAWEASFTAALNGATDHAILPAVADMVRAFQVPQALLYDIIAGVRSDLTQNRLATRAALDTYCYQVAGAVGIACVHIWGYRDPRALELAITCGEAFQLTNILRDLKEDAERDRVYLPLAELAQFDYSPDDLLRGTLDTRYDRLMAYQLDRAEQLYATAQAIEPLLSHDGRRVFRLMFGRYRAILAAIRREPRAVWQRRISLSLPHKLLIAGRQLLRLR